MLRTPSFSPDGSRIVFKIDEGDRCLGGREARVGLYWINAAGGEAHYTGPPGDAPRFSPDGQRIYYSTKSYINHAVVAALESVNLDGFDQRVHAKTLDADTSGAARQSGSEVDRVPSSSAVLRDPASRDRRAGDTDDGERQRQSRHEAQ